MAEELVTKGDHSLTFSRSLVLGSGTYGDVYGGKYNGKDVAIKRVQLRHINLNEDQSLQLDHDNVVKLHHCRDNEDFRFYVLERCAANLEQFCKGDYEGPMPSDAEVLYQLATGLEYIHAKRLHRDIKPENILISEPDPNVQIKWADFGLSKALNINGSCSMSGVRGTNNWIAPEIFRLRENPGGRGSPSSDIFSTGLVFFYFLKRGVHPFGKDREIESNIQNKKQANIHELSDDHFAKLVVIEMIAHEAQDRMALKEIIQLLKQFLPYSPQRAADDQLLAIEAPGDEIVFQEVSTPRAVANIPFGLRSPPVPLPLVKRRRQTKKKEPGEPSGDRKKPRKDEGL